MGEPVLLFPKPKHFKWLKENKVLNGVLDFKIPNKMTEIMNKVHFQGRLNQLIGNDNGVRIQVQVVNNSDLDPQGYVLQWDESGILFECNAAAGLHYALISFEQLLYRHDYQVNYFRLEDEPEFNIRGVMLDIGRNKIPKMKTLFAFIDQLAKLKINHLQLYMEGFSYEFKKYSKYFPEATPITAEEFQQLDKYATERFIDLVPNQNCFGHMDDWLVNPAFNSLAEHPDGMQTPYDFTVPPTTLNPINPQSINLIKDLFDDLLPNFTSKYVNVDMDEPFGLGTGNSKKQREKIGESKLYFNFAEKVFEIIRNHDKKVLMWGDFLLSHPTLLKELPDDVVVLDWNYEGHTSFEKHSRMLRNANIPFYVCPGTSSWSSISGRTDNMLANISDAAVNGVKYGADGLVVTDWGDNGHWQVQPISYPGYTYAAGVSWQVDENLHEEKEIQTYLSEVVFQDKNRMIGALLMDMGRYYHLENSNVENATYTNHLFQQGLISRESLEQKMDILMKIMQAFGGPNTSFTLDYQYENMLVWLQRQKAMLEEITLDIEDAQIVIDELKNSLRLIELGIGLHRFTFGIDIPDNETEKNFMLIEKSKLEIVISEFERLWLLRNRKDGLSISTKPLYKLLDQYEERLIHAENEK